MQRDIERLRAKVSQMALLAEQALAGCMRALKDKNRVLLYSIILRDQQIDELEKEIDRLCLEFIVRQQPVAGQLRFAYATIRINLELERVGDYAESIARQGLKLLGMNVDIPVARYDEIAEHSVSMLRNAVRAFLEQNESLARETMATEELVDELKSRLNSDLMKLGRENQIPIESLNALMMVTRHLERVSDQAKNICMEALYLCTGELIRHKPSEALRILFVDDRNACPSQMAEAIATGLGKTEFVFASAGLQPTAIDPATLNFLKGKELDVSRLSSKAIGQIPNLDHYQITIALAKGAEKVFPAGPSKMVCLDWSLPDPSAVRGTAAEVEAAYESAYQFLRSHILDVVEAVLGNAAS